MNQTKIVPEQLTRFIIVKTDNSCKGKTHMIFRESETAELKEILTDDIIKKSLLLATIMIENYISV